MSNLEQQRKLAKDLIRAARDGDAAAIARLQAVRVDAGTPPRSFRLADAQLAVSREAGFDSWPKLVTVLQERDVEAFRAAIQRGDVGRTQNSSPLRTSGGASTIRHSRSAREPRTSRRRTKRCSRHSSRPVPT